MDIFTKQSEKCKGRLCPKTTGSRFAACPVCGASVAMALMSHHLDRSCPSAAPPLPKKQRTSYFTTSSHLGASPPQSKGPQAGTLQPRSADVASRDGSSPGTSVAAAASRAAAVSWPTASPACSIAAAATPLSLVAIPHASLPGLWLIENFLSEPEEDALLRYLDGDAAQPWQRTAFNGTHRAKQWGVRTDLRAKKFLPAQHPLPPVLAPVIARMQRLGAHASGGGGCPPLRNFAPNEANAIEYQRALGHSLAPHCDDRQLSGAVLVNLCLAGDAVMTYKASGGGGARSAAAGLQESHLVALPRRALQVQSGTVRYTYRNGIPNHQLLHDRRVRITFRQNAAARSQVTF